MKIRLLPAVVLSLFACSASADGLIYFGVGAAEDGDSLTNSDTPWSIGAAALRNQGISFGIDLAGEGTVLDSTYSQDEAPNQALSVNLILAGNMYESSSSQLVVGLLAGFREATKDCPDSFLGFACYADQEPDVEYKANFGGLAVYSFSGVSVGARVTGESAQLVIGASF